MGYAVLKLPMEMGEQMAKFAEKYGFKNKTDLAKYAIRRYMDSLDNEKPKEAHA